MTLHPLNGIYVASLTPLHKNLSVDADAIPHLMDFYAQRCCHGALILGTTGEGPSFSPPEREEIWEASAEVRKKNPDFKLLAGTGTPSLSETIQLNQKAFELGFDAVVVLPPYYFRNASEEGIFSWYKNLIENSVPEGKYLLGYHIPQVAGVGLSTNLLRQLNAAFPARFGGVKDSSGDLANAKAFVEVLPGKAMLIGNDKFLESSLKFGAGGCITAGANLVSLNLRAVYDAHFAGENGAAQQELVNQARAILDTVTPFPVSLKALMPQIYDFPVWPVRPPLTELPEEKIKSAVDAFQKLFHTQEQGIN